MKTRISRRGTVAQGVKARLRVMDGKTVEKCLDLAWEDIQKKRKEKGYDDPRMSPSEELLKKRCQL